jgi:hypothetical protein
LAAFSPLIPYDFFMTSSRGWHYRINGKYLTSFLLALRKRGRPTPAVAKSLATRNERNSTMRPASQSSEKFLGSIFAVISLTLLITSVSAAQDQSKTPTAGSAQEAGTSTDLFIMLGSDFDRPGLLPKANYNIGIGHTFAFLKKDPLGDELTFAYTYEDAGAGFWHSRFGSDTESFGLMKNFGLPKTKRVSGYTWIQGGITSLTGNGSVENHFYDGESLGAVVHFTKHHSIWIQETFNKIVTIPWYTTTSIGYTRSW